MNSENVQTVVVELTPPGRAAVAVIVVAGPNAIEAVRHFFSPATPWRENGPPSDRIMLGRWGDEQGEELIVCRRGDDEFEIHCHGGAAAAPAIVAQLASVGCKRMNWREWLRSPRGRVSPRRGFQTSERVVGQNSIAGTAEIALAEATTARTAAVLLDQYHGALSSAIYAARAALAAANASFAKEIIDGILNFREVGLHLTTPWRVVIAGQPNVGKSSLINAIAGYQRAIVSPLPGTTRDVVTITTAIDGWPVQIADTAGLRETWDELESAGVALACTALSQADLVILVADASAPSHDANEFSIRLAPSVRVIHAVNKIDLMDGGEAFDRLSRADAPARCGRQFDSTSTQFVSALTGQGVAELIEAIARLLVPVAPPAGTAVAFTLQQIAGLEAALAAIGGSDAGAADAALASLLSTGEYASD